MAKLGINITLRPTGMFPVFAFAAGSFGVLENWNSHHIDANRETQAGDESRLQAAYDLTLREISQRLKAERAAQSGGPQFIAAAATPAPSSAAVNCGPPADGEGAT